MDETAALYARLRQFVFHLQPQFYHRNLKEPSVLMYLVHHCGEIANQWLWDFFQIKG